MAVVGVGGYVSAPACLAGFLLRIPVYLQEQNVSVGIANRMLGKIARKVFLGFGEAKSYFSAKKCIVTGNPIRSEFFKPFPYPPKGMSLLILGGSQGARAINELITGLLEVLPPTFPEISILHQTGEKDLAPVSEYYSKNFTGKYEVVPFIKDMAGAYLKASLVISRSGALTVSELIQVARPALFIPYPRKGQNDQTANAYLLQEKGAARVVEQGDRFKERFWATLLEIFHPEKLAPMHTAYTELRRENALISICDRIEHDIQ